MRQGDIATVREEEATEITSLPPSLNTTNMTENVSNNASLAGDNAYQTVNQLLIRQDKQRKHL
jgi:hypothetical protein